MTQANPILESHTAFARELVALARAHKVGNITAKFHQSFSIQNSENHHGSTWIDLSWSEGRGGSKSHLVLQATTRKVITEDQPND